MKIAVISDVHGNAFALEAVLKELRREAPDTIINLGDQVEGAADPARAYAMQRSLEALEVRGNNEEKWLPGGRRNPLSVQVGAWLATQLPAGAPRSLTQLPLTARIGGVLACHGTPESPWKSLLWKWHAREKGGYYRSRDPRKLRALLEPLGAEVVLCGHTHRAGMTRVGETLVINCGSVSDQVDGDPAARWLLLEQSNGHWTADMRRTEYDVRAATAWIRQHSPFAAAAAFLETGEMTGRGVL